MIRCLVDKYDIILKNSCEKFDFDNPQVDPIQLTRDLAETMISNNGLGLSAPQIGLPYRVFVITGEQITCCFNPTIIDTSSEEILLEEGCLSFPGLYIKVKRPRRIKLRYTQPNGDLIIRQFDDLSARIVQHEMDHLDGVCFTSKANSYHLAAGRKNLNKLVG